MKKFLSIFMVCLLSFLLVGCGCDKNKNKDKDNNKKDTEAEKITDTINALYSDDTKIVYDNGGVYKIVFFYNENEITGLQHYYEYSDENEAQTKYNEYKENYKNDASIKTITKSGKFVVFTFVGDQYEGKTVEEVQNDYSFLKPVYEK